MIAIIYLISIILLFNVFGKKIKDLQERIEELEFLLLDDKECLENEVND